MEPHDIDAQIASVANAPQAPTTLPSFMTLLQQAYRFTRDRIDLVGWYVAITIAAIVLFVVPIVVGGAVISSGQGALMALGVAVVLLGWAAALWVMVVAAAGLMYAVATGDDSSFTAGWQWAKPKFWAIAWIGLLLSLVFVGGFSLFIIPGLIISFYTLFYFLTFIRGDHRGLHALAASTHIVYGHFWAVAGRLILFGLVIGGINLLVALITTGLTLVLAIAGVPALAQTLLVVIAEIIGMLISLFLTIMMMRYMADLHAALSAIKPAYQPQPLSQSYKIYRGLAAFSLILLVVGSVALGLFLQRLGGVERMIEATTSEPAYDQAALEAELEAMIQAELESIE